MGALKNIWFHKLFKMKNLWSFVLALILSICLVAEAAYQLASTFDSYPWEPCNSFEATKKNCPRGEACLKLKNFKKYAWNWSMRCQSREEYIQKAEYIYGLRKLLCQMCP